MKDFERLGRQNTHTASNDASTVDNHGKGLDADLVQDPEQMLEQELIHAVPKDPVLEKMFRHISSHMTQKHVAIYLKLNFIKLAAVHTMKETDKSEADLVLALQALELDPAKCIVYTRDGPARKAYKAGRALEQNHKRVSKNAAIKLRRYIHDSEVQIPQVYHRTSVDDVSVVWYAICSDSHYSQSESLDLCHPLEFRVLVITHLHLIGGTPSQHKTLKKSKRTPYQQFLDLLPGFLSMARCSQTSHLGYSTKAPTTGPWLCQYAESLEALDVDCWMSKAAPRTGTAGPLLSPESLLRTDLSSCHLLTSYLVC
jgi:hypothetical protein